jgi:hypothetical protein
MTLSDTKSLNNHFKIIDFMPETYLDSWVIVVIKFTTHTHLIWDQHKEACANFASL